MFTIVNFGSPITDGYFSTNSEMFYMQQNYKSEKVYETFSWGYKNQGRTVTIIDISGIYYGSNYYSHARTKKK